jgi:hypothetical protein
LGVTIPPSVDWVDANAGNQVSNFVTPRRNHFQVRELNGPAKERAIDGRDEAARIPRGLLLCSAAVQASP